MNAISNRKLRLAMIGGGPGSTIASVHRAAAHMDGEYEFVAGAFSSDPEKSREQGKALLIDPARAYGSWEEMLHAENMMPTDRRPDVVAIITPNYMHYAPARLALDLGFHIIMEKPMTLTIEEVVDLRDTVARTGLIFALTHAYSAGSMVKLARDLIRQGRLGTVRKIVAECPQGWLYQLLEKGEDNKAASWRTDPQLAGAGCLGDPGTHAANLSETVSGLKITSVAADVGTVGTGRIADDDITALVRWEGGVRGSIEASQISAGEGNGLGIRVYGDKAGLRWNHGTMDFLTIMHPDKPWETWARNTAYANAASPSSARVNRCYSFHPEGYLEEFANIYYNAAQAIRCIESGGTPSELDLDFPNVNDGVRGMAFVQACLESSRNNAAWTDIIQY